MTEGENDGSYYFLYVLLRDNLSFRLYLLSALITQFGEWFTYVASITMIENILGTKEATGTAISFLVALRLLPSVLLSFLGGTLADSYDRRKSLIVLNLLGGVIASAFLFAYYMRSIPLLYLMVATQQSLGALGGPCGSALIPMLCQENELKQATMLNGLVWSAMSAIGAACGGYFVSRVGIPACFAVDSATFFLSGAILQRIPGKFDPMTATGIKKHYKSVWGRIKSMTAESAQNIRSSSFGAVLLFKASAASLYGASNVLNVAFSESANDGSGSDTASSEKMGMLYAVVGVGSILGPVLHDVVIGTKAAPAKLQTACIIALFSITVAYLGMGLLARRFCFLVFFSVIRSMGAAALWIDSTVVLQRFIEPNMLGRIMAMDLALALLAESGSAMLSGYLEDTYRLSPEFLSLILAGFGFVVTIGWTLHHMAGGGLAHIKQVPPAQHQPNKCFEPTIPVHYENTISNQFAPREPRGLPSTVLKEVHNGVHHRAIHGDR